MPGPKQATWALRGRAAVCALAAGALLASAAGEAAARGECARGRLDDLNALRGVNLPQLSFDDKAIPGTLGTNYQIPSSASVAYYTGKGMNLIRIGFLWERLQPTLNGPLDPIYLAHLMSATSEANRRGAAVLLDVHNFGRYRREALGSPKVPIHAFADLWSRLAEKFPGGRVMFGLMNEPHDQSAADWRSAVDAAVTAIRKTGAKNAVFIMGADWGNPRSWMGGNAKLMSGIKDANFVFEFHQYLDADGGGTGPVCKDAAHSVALLTEATDWLRRNNAHGFIGEIGIGANAQCMASLGAVLSYLQANRDVWLGWAYWAGGQGWGDYFTSIEPKGKIEPKGGLGSGTDAPQMAVLEKFLPCRDDGDARPPSLQPPARSGR
jgi:endoglucanase